MVEGVCDGNHGRDIDHMWGVVGGCMVDEAKTLDKSLTYYRLDNEPDEAWEAFILYRDQGLGRTVISVAKQLSKTRQLLYKWAKQYHWKERASLWQREIDGRATKQELLDRQAAQIRHIRIARRQQAFAGGQMEKHAALADELEKTAHVDADKAAKIESEAVKLERLILGDPTERTENTGALDWSNLDADEIIMFKALIVKLKGGKDD